MASEGAPGALNRYRTRTEQRPKPLPTLRVESPRVAHVAGVEGPVIAPSVRRGRIALGLLSDCRTATGRTMRRRVAQNRLTIGSGATKRGGRGTQELIGDGFWPPLHYAPMRGSSTEGNRRTTPIRHNVEGWGWSMRQWASHAVGGRRAGSSTKGAQYLQHETTSHCCGSARVGGARRDRVDRDDTRPGGLRRVERVGGSLRRPDDLRTATGLLRDPDALGSSGGRRRRLSAGSPVDPTGNPVRGGRRCGRDLACWLARWRRLGDCGADCPPDRRVAVHGDVGRVGAPPPDIDGNRGVPGRCVAPANHTGPRRDSLDGPRGSRRRAAVVADFARARATRPIGARPGAKLACSDRPDRRNRPRHRGSPCRDGIGSECAARHVRAEDGAHCDSSGDGGVADPRFSAKSLPPPHERHDNRCKQAANLIGQATTNAEQTKRDAVLLSLAAPHRWRQRVGERVAVGVRQRRVQPGHHRRETRAQHGLLGRVIASNGKLGLVGFIEWDRPGDGLSAHSIGDQMRGGNRGVPLRSPRRLERRSGHDGREHVLNQLDRCFAVERGASYLATCFPKDALNHRRWQTLGGSSVRLLPRHSTPSASAVGWPASSECRSHERKHPLVSATFSQLVRTRCVKERNPSPARHPCVSVEACVKALASGLAYDFFRVRKENVTRQEGSFVLTPERSEPRHGRRTEPMRPHPAVPHQAAPSPQGRHLVATLRDSSVDCLEPGARLHCCPSARPHIGRHRHDHDRHRNRDLPVTAQAKAAARVGRGGAVLSGAPSLAATDCTRGGCPTTR